jgi:thioredoxin 2
MKYDTTPETRMITCGNCGAVNRVPLEKLRGGVEAICGRCKKPLTALHQPGVITDANFADEVERSPLPILVDMWAPWCGPCRMVTPIVEELAAELAGRMRVGKLNVDENPVTSDRFQIRSIPALVIFQDGREVDRIIGAVPKSEILRHVQRILG